MLFHTSIDLQSLPITLRSPPLLNPSSYHTHPPLQDQKIMEMRASENCGLSQHQLDTTENRRKENLNMRSTGRGAGRGAGNQRQVRSPLITIKNPSSAPPALPPAIPSVTNDLEHSEPAPTPPVTELHTFYSAFTCALAMIHSILNFYTIIQEANLNIDNNALEKYRLFWGWTIFPLSLGAMCISWVIKVRKDAADL